MSPDPSHDPSHVPPFDVIAIGASAGGLEAMSRVLRDLPADFAVPIVYVQHMRVGKSLLARLLGKHTQLPIKWIEDGACLQARTVLIAPAGRDLILAPDGEISLIKPADSRAEGRIIDRFFASVAKSYGPRALAIVLSGMGADGAEGVQAIKQTGGTVFVQDEASSMYPSMPMAAAKTRCVDLVLPLFEIAPLLTRVACTGEAVPRPASELWVSQTLFASAGEVGTLLHATDWSRTPLGAVREWSPAFQANVATVLASSFPMAVLWGPDLIQIYNDAYARMLGDRHPHALGRTLQESWPEGWECLGPPCERVRVTGETARFEDQCLCTPRGGLLAERFATLSLSALRGEAGACQGILLVAQDTTERVLRERRLATLSALAEGAAAARTVRHACELLCPVLADSAADLPFALCYLFDTLRRHAHLAGAAGLAPGGPASPLSMRLFPDDATWPVDAIAQGAGARWVHDLADRFRTLRCGPWPQTPPSALLLPLQLAGQSRPLGCLILGTSPRLSVDPAYSAFLDAVASAVGRAVELGQRTQDLQQGLEASSELNRLKSEFFNNVSHQFRTPLTLMLGPIEEALGQPESVLAGPVRGDLEQAHRNGLRLLKLVNTLLDFSRIEDGRMRARIEPVDVATLTADLASGMRPAIEKAGLQLVVDCPPLDEPLYVDPQMWEKIVLHLLSNALKFTFAGSIEVRVRSLRQHVELSVRDTGGGIPAVEQSNIWKRFHRVPSARARTQEGGGIGLALVAELARLHNGQVRVRSEVGKGSVFSVWIPRGTKQTRTDPADSRQPLSTSTPTGATLFVQEAMGWLDDRQEDGAASSAQAPDGRKPRARILVSEGNPEMREHLRRLLGTSFAVDTADDGATALELCRTHPPDLVLVDVLLPDVDGLSILGALRGDRQTEHIPVILLTARTGEDPAVQGLMAGADDYVTKPFSASELLARVNAQLKLARERQRLRAAAGPPAARSPAAS